MQRRTVLAAAAQLQAATGAATGAGPLAAQLLQRLDAAGQRPGIHTDALQAMNEQIDGQPQQHSGRQQRRRLAHSAATPSGRGPSTPAAAAHNRRGLSTSAAAASAAQPGSPAGTSPDRGFASAAAQPALAFDSGAGDAGLPHVPMHDTAAAAATATRLRAQANARLQAMSADHQPRRRMVPAADEPGAMELRRVAVPQPNNDGVCKRPMWERLAAARATAGLDSSELQSESAAALQLYRQEVLHGHDVSLWMVCLLWAGC